MRIPDSDIGGNWFRTEKFLDSVYKFSWKGLEV